MRRVWRTLLLSLIAATAGPVSAQDGNTDAPVQPERPAAELVREGNARFADGSMEEALGLYDRARLQVPDSPELEFNRGLTHFRLGNLEQAGDVLNKAVGSANRNVESQSKFLLGNVEHLKAVQARGQDPQAAIAALERATRYYLDALAQRPQDDSLRADIELAQNLIELIRLEQQQQQQQQQGEQQQQKEQDQPEQQQEGEQQESEQQPQQQNQHEGEEQKQESEEQEGQEQQENTQEEDKQDSPSEAGEAQKREQQEARAQEAEGEEGEEQQAEQLSSEQVERMLQQIRDKERLRRLHKAEQARRRAGTVKKDW